MCFSTLLPRCVCVAVYVFVSLFLAECVLSPLLPRGGMTLCEDWGLNFQLFRYHSAIIFGKLFCILDHICNIYSICSCPFSYSFTCVLVLPNALSLSFQLMPLHSSNWSFSFFSGFFTSKVKRKFPITGLWTKLRQISMNQVKVHFFKSKLLRSA